VSGPIAVTGAGGYVGGRLVRALVAAGDEVRPFARRPVDWLPAPTAVGDLATRPIDELTGQLAGCAAVVHLAGANEVQAARDPDGTLAATAAAGRRVAAAARAAGVERLVVLSTTHVYGAAEGPVLGSGTLPRPRHPYAIARLAVEHLAAAAGPAELVVLRLTNAVGAAADPRVDRWSLVGNDLCRQASLGPTVRLRTSGLQWRDFIALGDAVEAIATAARGAVPAGTYDLGSGRSRQVLELARIVADTATELTGRATAVEAPAAEGAAPTPATVDVAPLAALGVRASTSLEDAVRETLVACLEHPTPPTHAATVRP
jgi:UDP-glucose 4-epimerase